MLHVVLKLLVHGLLPKLLHVLTRLVFKPHVPPRIKLSVLLMPSVPILLLPSVLVLTLLMYVPIKPMLIATLITALRLLSNAKLLMLLPVLVLDLVPRIYVLPKTLLDVFGMQPQTTMQVPVLMIVLNIQPVQPVLQQLPTSVPLRLLILVLIKLITLVLLKIIILCAQPLLLPFSVM